jgi:hypothetical protein
MLIALTGAKCAVCEVEKNLSKYCKLIFVAHAVCRRRLTAEAIFRSQVNPCEICGGESSTGTVFSLSITPSMLHTHLNLK